MNKKVLIICYTFPPNPGIGGRRWAKFAKYLNRAGVDVKVLTFCNENDSNNSNWTKDIMEFQDKIERAVPNKPYFLRDPSPVKIWGKIKYRISVIKKKYEWKGNNFEESVGMKDQILNFIESYHKGGYDNIIITCAPFLLSYYGALYKEKNPSINLILDYRDAWTSNKMGYQYRFLSKKRLLFAKSIEKYTINKANHVYAVNDSTVDYFKSVKSENNTITQVKLVPNGYDKDDLIANNLVKKEESAKLHIVYAGAVYDEVEYVLLPFINAINQIGEIDGIENRIHFSFYGNIHQKYVESVKKNKIISFNKPVNLTEIHQIICNCNACMVFLTKDLKDSLSTKFFEYIMMKKYTLVFSEEGDTAEFVEKNKIGQGISPFEIKNKLLKLINNPSTVHFNENFDSSGFDVKQIAKIVENDLI